MLARMRADFLAVSRVRKTTHHSTVLPFLAACRDCTPPCVSRKRPLSAFFAYLKPINETSAPPTAAYDVLQMLRLYLWHQTHLTNTTTRALLADEELHASDDMHRKTILTGEFHAQRDNRDSGRMRRIANIAADKQLALETPPEFVLLLRYGDATDRRFSRRLNNRNKSAYDTSPVQQNTRVCPCVERCLPHLPPDASIWMNQFLRRTCRWRVCTLGCVSL